MASYENQKKKKRKRSLPMTNSFSPVAKYVPPGVPENLFA
jgi:hypothetical protein